MGRARKEGGLEVRRRTFAPSNYLIHRRLYTMLKRLLTTPFFVVAVFGLTSGASAQYMRLKTDNAADSTRMRTSGTTLLTLSFDSSDHNDLSPQTSDAH